MKYINPIITILLITFLYSCQKLIFDKDRASDDPFENFDYLWNEVDKKYAYFTLKSVDWDHVRQRYRPMLYTGMSEDSLFNVLGNMLNELRDDHTNLMSPFNVSRYRPIIAGEDNFDYNIVRKYYINESEYTTGGFQHGRIKNQSIGYIRYKTFMTNVTNEEMDFLLNRYKNTIGIIIDLRENGGGNFVNIPRILNRFTDKKTLVMYNRTRNGPGRDDFGPYEPFYITPSDKIKYLGKPVVVLIDGGSYSASTFFALATKAMDNVFLIGETTGGGGGLPNGGQLPNGWVYRFSITQSYDLDKINYAEEGVPPDFRCKLNWLNTNRDEIVELAIDKIVNFAGSTIQKL